MRRTPSLEATGTYVLRDPWRASPTTIYICKAIRKFTDLEVLGKNVFEEYYKPQGLTQANFQEDSRAGAALITLMAESGSEVIYVPDTYIDAFPNMGDYHYRHMVLSASLGPIPDNLSLDWALEQVREVLATTLGIDPTVLLHEGAVRTPVSPTEHDRIEAARLAKVTNQTTWKAQFLKKSAEYDALLEKTLALEKILIDSGALGKK